MGGTMSGRLVADYTKGIVQMWLCLSGTSHIHVVVLPPARLEPNEPLSRAAILGVWGGSHVSGSSGS